MVSGTSPPQPEPRFRILVGFDERPQGHDALALGAGLAEELGGSVVVAQILNVANQWTQGETDDREVTETAAELARLAGRRLENIPHETLVRIGAPADELHDLAESSSADVVVVGSTHRGTVGRVLLGSVGESLVVGTRCLVAVAPLDYARQKRQHPWRKITVGYNGGRDSRIALVAAAGLAEAAGAALRVITAIRPPPSSAPGARYLANLEAEIREDLDAAFELVDPGTKVEATIVKGDPASVLIGQSAGSDALVVGSRERGPARRVILGSVSSEVMTTARCPVIVCPRGDWPTDNY